MKKLILFFLILFSINIQSCKKGMEEQTLEQNLTEFDTLSLNSTFYVYLIQGTENKIKITCASNILKKINISVKNNSLSLENNFHGNFSEPKNNKTKVYLTIKKLNRIIANETCSIKSVNTLIGDDFGLVMAGKLNEANLDVNCNYFYFWNNFPAGGSVFLSGKTNKLTLFNDALMTIDAHNMLANITNVENSSKGDCKVTCLQSFKYKILGEGNIYLSGNPTSITAVSENAKGKLIIQ